MEEHFGPQAPTARRGAALATSKGKALACEPRLLGSPRRPHSQIAGSESELNQKTRKGGRGGPHPTRSGRGAKRRPEGEMGPLGTRGEGWGKQTGEKQGKGEWCVVL